MTLSDPFFRQASFFVIQMNLDVALLSRFTGWKQLESYATFSRVTVHYLACQLELARSG